MEENNKLNETPDLEEKDQNINVNNSEVKKIPEFPVIKPKKPLMRKTAVLLLLVVLIMALAGCLAFWWRDNLANDMNVKQSEEIARLQSVITELNNKQQTDIAQGDDNLDCTIVAPDNDSKENIIASVTSGNTQPLEGHMASIVNVILAATEAYGEQTKTQSALDISDFIGDVTAQTWDFNLSESVINSYKDTNEYGKYFPEILIVGKSSDGKIISFSFDCEGLISTVFMSENDEIL